MRVLDTPPNSYTKFDKLQIFTNHNGARFAAMEGQLMKRMDGVTEANGLNVYVEPSTKEEFDKQVDLVDASGAMSHMYQEMYNKLNR